MLVPLDLLPQQVLQHAWHLTQAVMLQCWHPSQEQQLISSLVTRLVASGRLQRCSSSSQLLLHSRALHGTSQQLHSVHSSQLGSCPLSGCHQHSKQPCSKPCRRLKQQQVVQQLQRLLQADSHSASSKAGCLAAV